MSFVNLNNPKSGFLLVIILQVLFPFWATSVQAQKAAPSVTSETAINKQPTSVDIPYSVSGSGVTQQGVHYKTSSNVSTSDPKFFIDSYQASDTITISSLSVASRYYYKAFATNVDGTGLSVERFFWTLATEPTSNCGTISITSLNSTSISFSYSASTNVTQYAIFTIAGSTPVDPTKIMDGIATGSQTEGLFKQETTATSFSRSSLNPNTTYSVSVIPLKRSGLQSATNNYLTTGTITTVTFTTHKAAPTVQASDIVGSDKTETTATISWTNGNGDGRVVLINTSSSFTAPSNGDYPTGNSEYSGSGQQTLYNGTGSSVIVTGLTAGTTYFVRVYEYNNPEAGSTQFNTNTATGNPISCTLPYPRPEEQDYDIVFSDVTTNSMTVSWTIGDGIGRIAVMNNQNSFTSPEDSINYYADGYWNHDGEQIVYNGQENMVEITNLNENTMYYFRVFAYNDEPDYAVFNTETASNNPKSKRTLGDTPTIQDSQITFSNVTPTGITVSWTRGNGTHSLVGINTSSSFTSPTDGNVYTTNPIWQNAGFQRVYTGDQTTVNITGLTAGNTYHIRVWAYNNDEDPLYNSATETNNPNSIQLGGTNTWDGSSSGDWFTSANWSLNYAPISNNAIIIAGASNFPTLNQNATVSNVTIQNDGQLTVEDGVTLTVNGNLTINGNSGGSGSLVVEGSGSVNVSGTSYMTRHTGITSDWHLASIPNSNTNINQFNGHYVNRWNEPTNNWTQMTSSNALQVMRGYSIKYFNRDTVRFVGAFNNGSQSISVTNTNTGNEDYGWNMVGNPYPSAIDWGSSSGWVRTDIDNTAYMYDAEAGQYVTYNHSTGIGVPEGTSGIIPAGNGFYVLSNVSSTSLGIDNDARIHSSQTFLKSEKNTDLRILRLSISNGSSTDETAILFHPQAKKTINKGIDAYKLFSPKMTQPQIFTLSFYHDKKMMLSSINEETIKELSGTQFIEVPVGLVNNSEESVQLAIGQNTLGNEYAIYLYNRLTGDYHNLEDPYTLDNSRGEFLDMFSIRIALKDKPLEIRISGAESDMDIYSVGKQIYINSTEPLLGTLRIVDITGKIVYYDNLSETTQHIVKDFGKSGIFVILINDAHNHRSKLLFVE